MSGGLAVVAENATRLSQRLQETFSEHTRALLVKDTTPTAPDQIRKQLDSNSDREKLAAMRQLVAMISKSHGTTPYFAAVVKCVASPSLELRKLVYIFLLHFAPTEPDLALLSINTFQRDLNDSSPLIRAMALRVLSGMQVPMIATIVVMAIKKCASDTSPYVRKAAGLAIPKCFELDDSHLPALITILHTLLSDRSPLPLGTAAAAFAAICPSRLDILHQHYRRLCRVLVDVDEWGQVQITSLLVRYARTMLQKPPGGTLYDEPEVEELVDLDSDISLLMTSASPLFMSRNPAVVLAAARVFIYVAPRAKANVIVPPLLRLLHTSKEVQRVVLGYLCVVAKYLPAQLAPSYPLFLLRETDSPPVSSSKIDILLRILNPENSQAILREFVDASNSSNSTTSSTAITAIGTLASRAPEHSSSCILALVSMVRGSGSDSTITASVLILKHLVSSQPPSTALEIIATLAARIDDIRQPDARACVFFLVGQYASSPSTTSPINGMTRHAPDVLRKAALGFQGSLPVVKVQTISLAAKLLLLLPPSESFSPQETQLILTTKYIFDLARYDENWDVRDRARFIGTLVGGVVDFVGVARRHARLTSTESGDEAWAEHDNEEETEKRSVGGVVLRREQVHHVLFNGKKLGGVVSLEETNTNSTHPIGSMHLILNSKSRLDELPDWLERGTEGTVRDTEADRIPVPASVAPPTFISSASNSNSSRLVSTTTENVQKKPWSNLDEFYEQNEEEEEESSSEEEENEHQDEEEESGSDEETSEEGSSPEDADVDHTDSAHERVPLQFSPGH